MLFLGFMKISSPHPDPGLSWLLETQEMFSIFENCSVVSWQEWFALGNLNKTDFLLRFTKNPWGDADS